jgi:hypothetical protein
MFIMKKKSVFLVVCCFVLIFQLRAQNFMFKTGMLPEDKKPAGIELYDFETLGFGEKLPDSVSLVPYAPIPGNQGSYASCVGWAYGYCATSILYAQKHNMKNRTAITALALCPFSVYNRIKEPDDLSCSHGSYLYKGAIELKKQGTKRYHINEIGCNESSSKDSSYRIFRIDNSYMIWDDYQEKTVADSIKILYTKKALAIKTPVVIGFKATNSFCYDVRKSDGFWENDKLDVLAGGHAMCVVGYNDRKFGGAFLIQNSWGEAWGKDGYVWVSYEDYAKNTLKAYVIELSNSPQKPNVIKGCDYGNCSNGYSRFHFQNNDAYEGDVKDGKPNGSGIYQYANGDVYYGAFKSGKKEGKGTYYFSDGTVKVAYWQADTINNGADYMEYRYGNVHDGISRFKGYMKGENWIFGSYSSTSYSTSEYTGKFVNGKKNDFGIQIANGNYIRVGNVEQDYYKNIYAYIKIESKYIAIYNSAYGDFKKLSNEFTLAGKIASFTENKADSIATSDKKQCTYGDCENGYGKYIYVSGNTYEGFFTNGYRNGYGIYTLKENGKISIYEGTYLANNRDGAGKLTMNDASVFIGQFKTGQKEGYGLYYTADNKAVAGLWQKNVYQEWDSELGFGAPDDPQGKETQAKTEKNNKYKPMNQPQLELK